jgi:hypothetical protein
MPDASQADNARQILRDGGLPLALPVSGAVANYDEDLLPKHRLALMNTNEPVTSYWTRESMLITDMPALADAQFARAIPARG